jgi:hypothetical protein
MRITQTTLVLCGLIAAVYAPMAHADFVVQPSSEQTPTVLAGANGAGAPKTAVLPTAHFAVAQGFGDQVPLAFAIRQIVPSTIKVQFGKSVDQTALVDWKGGQQWNVVLWSAIHPLGLHLVLKEGAVWIFN